MGALSTGDRRSRTGHKADTCAPGADQRHSLSVIRSRHRRPARSPNRRSVPSTDHVALGNADQPVRGGFANGVACGIDMEVPARRGGMCLSDGEPTRTSSPTPRTARPEPAQCHSRQPCSPSTLTSHFEGSRGGRLSSRRHAQRRRTGQNRAATPYTTPVDAGHFLSHFSQVIKKSRCLWEIQKTIGSGTSLRGACW